jgi:hypothetical protein
MTRRIVACLAALIALAGCSGDDDSSTSPTSSATTVARPAGPAAEISADLTGGNGTYLASAKAIDLEDARYVQEEFAASGTATSYRASGALAGDGRWSFEADAEAPYRTRILVRRPEDPARFSGTIVVEWLNVSGGVDTDAEWVSLNEEILRRGHAWVGVSAQRLGVMGGPVAVPVDVAGSEDAGKGLRAIDPERYGSLEHPGDGFAFDIYTQAARAIRAGDGLSGLQPERLVAAGESQSAFALVTYYNGVQPLTNAFDGFFVHSRGSTGMALVGPGESADIAGAIGGTATIFRTDQDAPVLDLQTETDVSSLFSSYAARQDDSETFRLWEVAGTAHFDQFLLGATAEAIDCGVPINNGALHVVAKAGMRALTTWIERDQAPVNAPRLDVTPGPPPQAQRDADGIALGGIRTPPVDVPVATLSGAPGPEPSAICLLLGTTTPFSDARIAELYPSRDAYEEQYDEATDAVIAAGFVLDDDRDALLDFADASRISG